MEAGEVEGVGGEVNGVRLVEKGVPLILVTWMRFCLTPSRVSCVLLCPSRLFLLYMCCILVLLVDLSQVMWGPSRHLGSLTVAKWVYFDFNVARLLLNKHF